MKAILMLCAFGLAAVVNAPSVKADLPPGCAALVTQINTVVSLINQNAPAYWTHRANFVDLIYGPSSQVVPNARQLAEQEKSKGDALRAGMPGRVNSLKGLLTAVKAMGGCGLSPDQLIEPPLKQGKRVDIDQFPDELPESVVGPGPRQLP
jgi:hypothetical protein